MTDNDKPTEMRTRLGGMSRREFMRQSQGLGLSLPLLSGLAPALGLGLTTSPANATTAGQCVLGVTQEAVNFNPLLYVNTGVETSVEFIVFDALWKLDPDGKFVPNLAAECPNR